MRNKNNNDIRTKTKHVKVGKRVIVNGEPKLLVGPEANKDYFSLQDMAEAMYGQGAICHVSPPTD